MTALTFASAGPAPGGYRASLALIRNAKRYGRERMEAACARAIDIGSPSRKSVDLPVVRSKPNVIVVGATVTGKTFLGTALAQAACCLGLRALCTRAPRLLHDLAIARGDGSYTTLLQEIARADVLVLDDLLIEHKNGHRNARSTSNHVLLTRERRKRLNRARIFIDGLRPPERNGDRI